MFVLLTFVSLPPLPPGVAAVVAAAVAGVGVYVQDAAV
jgi:hypothetical protein